VDLRKGQKKGETDQGLAHPNQYYEANIQLALLARYAKRKSIGMDRK
jgi:hypothetical protein